MKQYLGKLTSLGRAQLTRLIGSYLAQGSVPVRQYQRRVFRAHYTEADVRLLAYVDQAHGTLSGPAAAHPMAGGGCHAAHLRSLTVAAAGSHVGAVSIPTTYYGSEFINYQVFGLLNKLLIQQTKSRPRHSRDNALVEDNRHLISVKAES